MQLGPTQEPKVLDGIQGRHEGVFVEAFPGRSNAQGQWVYRCSWGVSVLDNGTPRSDLTPDTQTWCGEQRT